MKDNSTLLLLRKLLVLMMLTAAGLLSVLCSTAQTCNTDLTNGIAASAIAASGENAPNESRDKAFDNIKGTKWLTNAATGFLQVDLGTAKIVSVYSLTSGYDVPTRDPKDFTLSGSNDGISFTTLDIRTGETFASRMLTQYYSFTNSNAYRYYKLTITLNNGSVRTQLSEIELLPNNNCIVGKVYNGIVGLGYPGVPVLARTAAGTVASTVTNASGAFAFTTANAPDTDYAILVQPPAGTYFASGPAVNFNASVMSTDIYDYFQQEVWPTGAFLNVNGDINAATNNYYTIDNTEGAKTPASFDWLLKTASFSAPTCSSVPISLDGNGTFGNLPLTNYINEHAWQPGFHTAPVPAAGESHPNLFRSLITGTSDYGNGNLLYDNRGSLYGEGDYNVTSFIGTIQDAVLVYGRLNTGSDVNSTFNLLNGHNGGWRKTYGRTTGDPYDLFLAANGQTTTLGSIVEFTATISTIGTKYLNFYGKNANSAAQTHTTNSYPDVKIICSIYNSAGLLVTSSTMTLSPVTNPLQDNPASPWEARSVPFNVIAPGTYTIKMSVPTTAKLGNDFYVDNIEVADCAIQYTLTGKVWDDANGNAVQNTTELITPAISSSLFVNLVNQNGFLLSTVKVGADGTYSMPIPANATGYKLVLTGNSSLTTASLPAGCGWINTGENVNTLNTATQSGALGVIELNTGTYDIPGQNFGIEQPPVSIDVWQTVPSPIANRLLAGLVYTAIKGIDPEDGILGNANTMVVKTLPSNATLFYNGVSVSTNQHITNFKPSLLSYTNISAGATEIVFRYAHFDAASAEGTAANYTINWMVPVPLKLISFTANATGCNQVALDWKISDVVGFKQFEIERKSVGGNFKTIKTVSYDASRADYHLTDNHLAGSDYQYRLKMVDADGKFTYSPVVFIRLDCIVNKVLKTYPNPVKDNITISGVNTGDEIVLYSPSGQVIQNWKITGKQKSLDMSAVTDGVYYLLVKNEAGLTVSQSKIIKVH